MGYDRGDSFPLDFEPNGNPFGSEYRKENCHHDHIPFNVKGIGNIVFPVCCDLRDVSGGPIVGPPRWQEPRQTLGGLIRLIICINSTCTGLFRNNPQ